MPVLCPSPALQFQTLFTHCQLTLTVGKGAGRVNARQQVSAAAGGCGCLPLLSHYQVYSHTVSTCLRCGACAQPLPSLAEALFTHYQQWPAVPPLCPSPALQFQTLFTHCQLTLTACKLAGTRVNAGQQVSAAAGGCGCLPLLSHYQV